MNPTYVDIKETQGLVTNIDQAKAPGNIALDMRGVRSFSAGKVMQRDWGTRNVLSAASYAQVTTTPAPDQTIKGGFYLYDPDTGLDHLVLMTVDTGSPDYTHFWLETTGAAAGAGTFIELTQTYTYTINSVSNKVVTFTTTLSTADDSLNGWIAVNTSRAGGAASVQFIEDCDQSDGSITVGSNVGTAGGGSWAGTDSVTIFRSLAMCWSAKAFTEAVFDRSLGTSAQGQHMQALTTEAQAKALICYGDVSEVDSSLVVANRPFYVKYEAARGLFIVNGSATITRPTGWWCDQGGDPCPDLYKLGTLDNPNQTQSDYTSPQTATSYFYGIDKATAWGKIDWKYGGYDTNLSFRDAGFVFDFHRFVVTLTLDEYGETDPVAELFFVATATVDNSPQWTVVIPDFYINPGLMPRNLTAINVYHTRHMTATNSLVRDQACKAWSRDNGRLRLNTSISLTEQNISKKTLANVNWAANANDVYPYKLVYAYSTWQDTPDEGTVSIDGALGRAARTEDEEVALKPRFACRASRQQGSVTVTDESDSTLRLSVVDGYGVSADQIFPEVPYDVNNRIQRLELTGHGSIMGMALNNDQVVVFKQSEIEFIDLQSNLSTILQADCIARKSILETPHGVIWAGDGAIYLLPRGEFRTPRVINQAWQNRYSGQELLADNVTQYITQAYRKEIISGYDPFFQEAWFHVQQNITSATSEYLCYRYSFLSGLWSIREINVGAATPVIFFTKNGKNEFIACISNQLLYYPNRDFTAFPYEDGVVNDGDGTYTSASYGVPTWIKFNLGAFNSISDTHVATDIMLDHVGDVVSGTAPEITVEFFADRETTAFDTKTLTIADDPVRRKIEPRGSIQNLQMKVSLPTADADLIDVEQFDINLIQIGVVPKGKRIGNA